MVRLRASAWEMTTSLVATGTPPSQLLARLQLPEPLNVQVEPIAQAGEELTPMPPTAVTARSMRCRSLGRAVFIRPSVAKCRHREARSRQVQQMAPEQKHRRGRRSATPRQTKRQA